MCLPRDNPRDDLADHEQEGDALKMAQIGSRPVTSRRVPGPYSKCFRRMALQTPDKCRQACVGRSGDPLNFYTRRAITFFYRQCET